MYIILITLVDGSRTWLSYRHLREARAEFERIKKDHVILSPGPNRGATVDSALFVVPSPGYVQLGHT